MWRRKHESSTDLPKQAASSAPPPRAHSARRGTAGAVVARARAAADARGVVALAARGGPRDTREGTGRREAGRTLVPPCVGARRDHGAPRRRHRVDPRCHRVDRGEHRLATPRRAADHGRARGRGGRAVRARASPADRHHVHGTRKKSLLFSRRTARSFFFGDGASLSFRRRRRAEISSNARRRRPNDDRTANTRHTKRKALPNAVHVELTVRIFLFFFQSRRTSAYLRVPPAPYIKKRRSVPFR